MQFNWDVVVVGAGAAGLLAAARAAERGRRTLLLEKNKLVGVKILMSGGTRCNLTQNTDRRGIIDAFGKPGRFLHSALAALGPAELVQLVEAEGVPTKVEPSGKIYPVSDRAVDIRDAFARRLARSGCTLALSEPVVGIESIGDGFRIATPGHRYETSTVILTTGGMSYPGCGTTGDGYVFARQFGHAIVPPRPALTPIDVPANWVRALQGVAIADAMLAIEQPSGASLKKRIAERRGALLLTHFGLSGPVALDISRVVSGHERPADLLAIVDFLPAISQADLDASLRDFAVADGKRRLATAPSLALPNRLVESLLVRAGIEPNRRAAELSRDLRFRVVENFKNQTVKVAGTLGFKKAEVTAGGVSLDEVHSKTMESKLRRGLFFAGEILDLDGTIGGYNFQAAFSTGYLAGSTA